MNDGNHASTLGGFGTTAVSDALDTLGIDGGCIGLRPVTPGMRCVGPAVTIRFEPVAPGQSGPAADYIDEVPSGSVIVLDNFGRTDCTVWGDILTGCAQARGLSGTVIHGCCRDSAGIQKLNYPVFSLSSYMKSGKNRVRMAARDVPVTVGKTTIRPGDVILADDDGVLAIPGDRVEEVAGIAAQVVEMEKRVLVAVSAGMPLIKARRSQGYDRFSWRAKSAIDG